MDLLASVDSYEPLFYRDSGSALFVGKATGGTETTLVDGAADFVSAPFFAYIRIYAGTGAGQVAELDPQATTQTTLTVRKVWLLADAFQYTNAVRYGAGAASIASWITTPDATSEYILVPWSKLWRPWDADAGEYVEFPAIITPFEILGDAAYGQYNLVPVSSGMDDVRNALNAPFPSLETPTFLEVPALYLGDARDSPSGWAFAWVPGMPNLQVWSGTPFGTEMLLAKPYGPRSDLLRIDVFEETVQAALAPAGTVRFLDNWNTYHRMYGEVHCGTNVLRNSDVSFQHWWQAPPSR